LGPFKNESSPPVLAGKAVEPESESYPRKSSATKKEAKLKSLTERKREREEEKKKHTRHLCPRPPKSLCTTLGARRLKALGT
jgi:hypothetical protein